MIYDGSGEDHWWSGRRHSLGSPSSPSLSMNEKHNAPMPAASLNDTSIRLPSTGPSGPISRRSFVSTAAAVGGAAAGAMVHSSTAAAEEVRDLRLAVVGCGGRGSGAINNSLTINQHVKLVAAADLYVSKCASLRKAMSEAHADKVAIEEPRMYGGLDGYRRILDDPDIDIVLITTSPGFRPAYVARRSRPASTCLRKNRPASIRRGIARASRPTMPPWPGARPSSPAPSIEGR